MEEIVKWELSVGVNQTVKFDHDLFDRSTLEFTVICKTIIPQVLELVTILVNFLNFSFPSNLVNGEHLKTSE